MQLADEEDAKDILAKTTRSAADRKKVLELAEHMAHETQHARFNPEARNIVTEAADCRLETAMAALPLKNQPHGRVAHRGLQVAGELPLARQRPPGERACNDRMQCREPRETRQSRRCRPDVGGR